MAACPGGGGSRGPAGGWWRQLQQLLNGGGGATLLLLLVLLAAALEPCSAGFKDLVCPKDFDKNDRPSGVIQAVTTGTVQNAAAFRRSQYFSYCEMETWLATDSGIYKGTDIFEDALKKFKMAYRALVGDFTPFISKPRCDAGGVEVAGCVAVGATIVAQALAGPPLIAALDTAAFISDLICGKLFKEAIQQYDLGGTVAAAFKKWRATAKKAKDAAETTAKLDSPIPKGARSAADAAKTATDKVEKVIGAAADAADEVEQQCTSALFKFINSPPVRCFRCALDRYMALAAWIEAGASVVYGILVAVESGMISAAANYHGLSLYSAPCPQTPPGTRDAPCRPEYSSRYTKPGSGRRRSLLIHNEGQEPAAFLRYHGDTLDDMRRNNATFKQLSDAYWNASSWEDSMAMMQRRLQAGGAGGDMLEALMLAADGLDKAAAVTQAMADALDTAGDALVKAGWNQFKTVVTWFFDLIELGTKMMEPFDVVTSILEKISDMLGWVKCPSFLSFICNLTSILEDLIDEAIEAVTGKTLAQWGAAILDFLGLDKLLSFIPTPLSLKGYFKQITDYLNFYEPIVDSLLNKMVEELKPFLQIAKFDPELTVYGGPSGAPWPFREGVIKKVTQVYEGAPAQVTCPSGYYPVTEFADRYMWKCRQSLSALLRFPCATGSTGCTVDYDGQFGDTVCKRPENQGAPAPSEQEAMKKMFSVTRLDQADYFRLSYLCVPNGMKFNVISELFSAWTEYQTKFETNIHTNTGQAVFYVDPLLREGNNTGLRDADCSNGDRAFYLEYLKPPTMGGKYAWHPCMTQWLPDQLASSSPTKQARLKELCWYKVTEEMGLHTKPKMSVDTKLPADAPTLDTMNNNKSAAGIAQLPYECLGDAAAVYFIHEFGRDSWNPGSDGGYDDNYWVYYPSWSSCVGNGYNKVYSTTFAAIPHPENNANPKEQFFEELEFNSNACWENSLVEYHDSITDSEYHPEAVSGKPGAYRHPANEFEWYTGRAWCDANFPAPGVGKYGNMLWARVNYERCGGDKDLCYLAGKVDEFINEANLASRRAAKRERKALWDEFTSAAASGASNSYATACQQYYESCNGAGTCDFSKCIPEVQYSCMEPMYYKPVNVSSADSSRVFYIFADSLRTKESTARCGAGQLIKIKGAELGAGVFSSDVTNQVILQCSATSNTCKVDLSKLSGTTGKALRVEYVCVCSGTSGAQPMPAPGGDPVFGQCLPCPAGTYRGEFEIDCMPCPAGTASNATGVTSCPPCPAGTASTEKGALVCSACSPGKSSEPGSQFCTDCPANTYAPSFGEPVCKACPAGSFSTTAGSAACTQCNPGSYKTTAMDACAPCPVGTYALESGAGTCTPCGPGRYGHRTGATECYECPIGTYQDGSGQPRCIKCPSGTYTATPAAKSAADCSVTDRPVNWDELAVQTALQGLTASGRKLLQAAADVMLGLPGSSHGRKLLQSSPPTLEAVTQATALAQQPNPTLCASMLAAVGATTDQLGNGICNGGPFNTAICSWDGGDCCEATCRPNRAMGGTPSSWSCDPRTMQCRNPAVIRAAAAGTLVGRNCTPAGTTADSPVPADAPTTCPAGSAARLGNGFCDDDLNIPACQFDNGDCCLATCQPTEVIGSCARETLNCRNPAQPVDTQPPELINLPQPATQVVLKPYRWLLKDGTREPMDEVAASDNWPCFSGKVTTTDVNVTRDRSCADRVLFHIQRTWATQDAAGNTASASRVFGIVDDQDYSVGTIVVTLPTTSTSPSLVRQTLSVGASLPNKEYTWALVPQPGNPVTRTVTKTGGSTSFSFSNTAATNPDVLATTSGTLNFNIELSVRYLGCIGTNTPRKSVVGVLQLLSQGVPAVGLTPSNTTILYPSGSATFRASTSWTTATGIQYSWTVTSPAGVVVVSRPASSANVQLTVSAVDLKLTARPTTAQRFTVTLIATSTTGQRGTATAVLNVM